MKMKNNLLKIIEVIKNNQSEHELYDPKSSFVQKVSALVFRADTQQILENAKEIIVSESYCSGSSILHENGFTKISLYKDPNTQLQLRLHLWPEGVEDTNIHNHRWNFLSFLVSGDMSFTNWLPSPSNVSSLESALYEVTDANKDLVKERTFLRNVSLDAQCQYRLKGSSLHFCHKDTLHSGSAHKNSVSLMITGTPTKSSTHVVYRSKKRMSVTRKKLSIEQQVDAIVNGFKEQHHG
ncbi:hypothetical protein ST37_10040 [Vibrio sp. qd031]|nr:hypothetical protein ST37_10040 [Vibrio sp. qd031]